MIFRFFVSAVLGAAVVAGLLVTGVTVYRHGSDRGELIYASPVELLNNVERIELGKLLGEDWDPNTRRLPEPPALPPMMPPRQVSGFVQLEFDVDASGAVDHVQVIGATPSGYYEDQARALIESRRYAPTTDAQGTPLPSRRTEIVDFRVLAGSDSDTQNR